MKCRHCESSKLSKRGVRGNKQRYHCKKCGKWSFQELNIAVESSVEFRSKVKQHKRYVITCAQNNTKVHQGFLKSLLHMDAELVVIPINYQNVSLFKKNEEKSNKKLNFFFNNKIKKINNVMKVTNCQQQKKNKGKEKIPKMIDEVKM